MQNIFNKIWFTSTDAEEQRDADYYEAGKGNKSDHGLI